MQYRAISCISADRPSTAHEIGPKHESCESNIYIFKIVKRNVLAQEGAEDDYGLQAGLTADQTVA